MQRWHLGDLELTFTCHEKGGTRSEEHSYPAVALQPSGSAEIKAFSGAN